MSDVTVTPRKDRATWAQGESEHDGPGSAPKTPTEPLRPGVLSVTFTIHMSTELDREQLGDIREELERGMKILDKNAEVDIHVR